MYCWKYGRIPLEECEWNIGGNDFEAWSIASDIIGELGIAKAFERSR